MLHNVNAFLQRICTRPWPHLKAESSDDEGASKLLGD
jgi:hypothetical protein